MSERLETRTEYVPGKWEGSSHQRYEPPRIIERTYSIDGDGQERFIGSVDVPLGYREGLFDETQFKLIVPIQSIGRGFLSIKDAP